MTEGGNYHFGFIDNEGISTSVVREFKAKPGRWVGARIGLFCLRNNNTNDAGYADVDWVRFVKPTESIKRRACTAGSTWVSSGARL